MSRGDPQRLADYLGHILDAIDSIRDYTSQATRESYLADRKTQDAVVRNSKFAKQTGTFTIPARTTAVFVEPCFGPH